MHGTIAAPLARSEDLVIEETGDELLVYDLRSNRAHCLNAVAAAVWRACDGQRAPGELIAELELDADAVGRALDELAGCQLLDEVPVLVKGRGGPFRRRSRDAAVVPKAGVGLTRRETTIKMAQYGATAMAIPLIWSIAGPIPEAAATPTPAQCMQYTDKSCDACDVVQGCCCCCQGGGSCKTCYTASLCSSFTCPASQGGGAGHCSTTCGPNDPNCVAPGAPFVCKSNGQPGPPSGGAPCCVP
jgi:hypothetical protein